jgi:hypothetical protein
VALVQVMVPFASEHSDDDGWQLPSETMYVELAGRP